MQYGKTRVSKLAMRSDSPTGVSSSVHGANVDAVGFNIAFIAARRPQLAVEIVRLWRAARELSADTPLAPDEDALSAEADLRQLRKRRQ
ncbi:hypothetical protein [Amycolatopsis sp.]|uniref:hypothetical protein n=1 Tax=Amycolatopsis sp. TaxID=37632 RepID=UPI002B6A9A86|nr:hypothetical protein [Amycolatopsis sp.]HVV12454.1 hypothetical protein [Amycolatopsis sp.]